MIYFYFYLFTHVSPEDKCLFEGCLHLEEQLINYWPFLHSVLHSFRNCPQIKYDTINKVTFIYFSAVKWLIMINHIQKKKMFA